MKSVVAEDGKICVIDHTIPTVKSGFLLIKTLHSVISPGTELSMLSSSQGKTVSLGYSAVGRIIDCGEGTDPFYKGELVACYGAPYVKHSEYLLVPKTLCCSVPAGVQPREAALAGLGAIAIHALRLANLQFGESVVVAGLGVLGQLIAQISNSVAYQVIPYEINEGRANLFQSITGLNTYTSIEDLAVEIKEKTNGNGADAVMLCAGGGKSELTNESLKWLRDRGKVVIVGDIEPHFNRQLMFAKEAQILISRAGGPGRYDPVYEKSAQDYPYGFIRWTEGRNIEEYLRLILEKRIKVKSYLQHSVIFQEIHEAYEELKEKNSDVLTKVIDYNLIEEKTG
ncbi:zinc-dependent alcohol dehydrogenase [Metabacillus arenae]|uniref:Zinc-binding alcohol dehydrogenase n=1 Tax=Metabacillus arenae TaxID=2771434 RepID=A0A926NFU1_9BACI|nr:zinc-binding alcohol dehydrogenase [Metabacillus arenae]MBD1380486.1 zinc-binding alcohol dehydrogenase [Metabacillus arenae]